MRVQQMEKLSAISSREAARRLIEGRDVMIVALAGDPQHQDFVDSLYRTIRGCARLRTQVDICGGDRLVLSAARPDGGTEYDLVFIAVVCWPALAAILGRAAGAEAVAELRRVLAQDGAPVLLLDAPAGDPDIERDAEFVVGFLTALHAGVVVNVTAN